MSKETADHLNQLRLGQINCVDFEKFLKIFLMTVIHFDKISFLSFGFQRRYSERFISFAVDIIKQFSHFFIQSLLMIFLLNSHSKKQSKFELMHFNAFFGRFMKIELKTFLFLAANHSQIIRKWYQTSHGNIFSEIMTRNCFRKSSVIVVWGNPRYVPE